MDIFLTNKDSHAALSVLTNQTEHRFFLISPESLNDALHLKSKNPQSDNTLQMVAHNAQSDYILLQLKPGVIGIDFNLLERMESVAKQHKSTLAYGNYTRRTNGEMQANPTIEYTLGSIRDNFDFGPAVIIQTKALKAYAFQNKQNYHFAGWYNLRLFLSRIALPLHININAFEYDETDLRQSGQRQFDYVDPRNRSVQIEMEQAGTLHLEAIGALVKPPFKTVDFDNDGFGTEATVIIPVRNRVRTIAEAVKSVLAQKTNFSFNLIVIDNHSTDGTTELLKNITDDRLIHRIPARNDLGIGGCWNEGINHPRCGRFAVQLDSDDLYSSENTLQKVVDTFRKEQCAMVIGSYKMVNFNLEEIPPGIIDHREWTNNNGPNNALRINGLGAPRAFYTPIIRQIGFPNVSYGEDYAVAIAISRTYNVGRIYDPIYLCRRWDDNTDANLSIEKENAHNVFKDLLRTKEISERKHL